MAKVAFRCWFVAFVLLSAMAASADDFAYEIHDLGFLPGGVHSEALGISESGKVVGFTQFPNNAQTACLLTRKLEMVDLGNPEFDICPGSVSSVASGVNASGQVVGGSCGRAVLWDRDGSARDLGTLPGGLSAAALAISNSGLAVGYSLPSFGQPTATLWGTKHGTVTPLVPLSGFTGSVAMGVNESGASVGESRVFDSLKQDFVFRATMWDRNGRGQDLGIVAGYASSAAYDINNRGQVVGLLDSGRSAFLWTADTGMRNLSVLTDGIIVSATGINDRGQIAGTGRGEALLFNPDGSVTHLPGLAAGFSSNAVDVNNAGWVIGKSQDALGAVHAVLWTPGPAAKSEGCRW